MAVALTAFGVFIASRIAKMESFQVVMQLLAAARCSSSPGRCFRSRACRSWLAAITRINPLTYAVDPLRHVVFAAQHMPPAARERFPTGVELFGHILPLGVEIGIVAAFAVVFLALAIHTFGKPE